MGIFDKLFNGNKIEIASPVKGEIIPINTVSDATFAQEIIGKGVAIVPADGKFHAPADGLLQSMFPTGHAFGIKTDDGAELLVHIGFDTVKLKGEHFSIKKEQGSTVKKGDLIVEVDLDAVKAAGYDVTTPVIIVNSANFASFDKKEGSVNAGDAVLVLGK